MLALIGFPKWFVSWQDGSTLIQNRVAELQAPHTDSSIDVSRAKEGKPVTPTNKNLGIQQVEAPTPVTQTAAFSHCTSLVDPYTSEHVVTDRKAGPHGNQKREISSTSSDIMEKARAAIASAERASAAARAAAELVNVKSRQ